MELIHGYQEAIPRFGDRGSDSGRRIELRRQRQLELDRFPAQHRNGNGHGGWWLGSGWRNARVVIAGPALPDRLRRIVADTWAFRWKVELEAEIRFARLAERLSRVGALPAIVEMASRAASDERRHASICAELALEYGHPGIDEREVTASEIAPRRLSERQRALYEVVAACCITETESASVLTALVNSARSQPMLTKLRELLRDEVSHSRLGWAHLAQERAQGDVSFLSRLVPYMLEGTIADGLFEQSPVELESPQLLEHGVLPHSSKRSIFVGTLSEVIFPGLEKLGVDPGPGREWLSHKSPSH